MEQIIYLMPRSLPYEMKLFISDLLLLLLLLLLRYTEYRKVVQQIL